MLLFLVAGVSGYFAADAGKFTADAVYIAAVGGNRIRIPLLISTLRFPPWFSEWLCPAACLRQE